MGGAWGSLNVTSKSVHNYLCTCLINRKTKTMERHSAVWGKFDGKEREVWLRERGRDR